MSGRENTSHNHVQSLCHFVKWNCQEKGLYSDSEKEIYYLTKDKHQQLLTPIVKTLIYTKVDLPLNSDTKLHILSTFHPSCIYPM